MIDFLRTTKIPSNEKYVHYSREIIKVIDFLNERKQDFQVEQFCAGWSIIVPNRSNYMFDVVCNDGSYGHERGLLETQGVIVGVDDTVEGWLTGEQVIDRIKEFYLHENKEDRAGYCSGFNSDRAELECEIERLTKKVKEYMGKYSTLQDKHIELLKKHICMQNAILDANKDN